MKPPVARPLVLVGLWSSLLATGCSVLPGSTLVLWEAQGTVTREGGGPLEGTEVALAIPGSYGFEPSELASLSPELLRSLQTECSAITDASGAFRCDLGSHAYHVDLWVFPPLGTFPRRAPAPSLLIRLTSPEPAAFLVEQSGSVRLLSGDAAQRGDASAWPAQIRVRSEGRDEIGVLLLEIRLRPR